MASIRTFLLLAVLVSGAVRAEERLTIAVASNFLGAAQEISAAFTERTGTQVRLSSGSTARLYAQIVNGAPYDIFLAADVARPKLLQENGLAVPGSQFTYATGSLVLWSTDPSLQGKDCRAALEEGAYKHLAIANPRTAPYGLAAKKFLQGAELWAVAKSRLVFGENIAQTFQFVATANATLGLVAASQIVAESQFATTCSWPVPPSGAALIRQDGVILRRTSNMAAAESFMEYMRVAQVLEILQQRGYLIPVHPAVEAE